MRPMLKFNLSVISLIFIGLISNAKADFCASDGRIKVMPGEESGLIAFLKCPLKGHYSECKMLNPPALFYSEKDIKKRKRSEYFVAVRVAYKDASRAKTLYDTAEELGLKDELVAIAKTKGLKLLINELIEFRNRKSAPKDTDSIPEPEPKWQPFARIGARWEDIKDYVVRERYDPRIFLKNAALLNPKFWEADTCYNPNKETIARMVLRLYYLLGTVPVAMTSKSTELEFAKQ